MTAVSFSLSRGVDGFKMSDVTVGSNAPSSGDVELRFNVTDTNGKNMNALDIYRIVESLKMWVLNGGGSVSGNLLTSITNQPSGPPS